MNYKRQPGPDLDVEIARDVLKFNVWQDEETEIWLCFDPRVPDHRVPVPKYSTDTDHAYRIVHEFQNRGYMIHFGSSVIDEIILWKVTIFVKDSEQKQELTPTIGETLPHAICLAALDVLGPKEEPEVSKLHIVDFPKKD